ncbi:GNAT family N-acetyltransferase [Haloarchaeobius sp. HME9146]|uniref:GNAT family N-acetyltransferase n=1 Tax=Haloarchaeobius sp. HME9146 TaxID=2978732 RepID=UPI0021C22FE3|nr:GNAT family protein [Haloarchaeobius sp. HME9146]MCT9097113.1 GNAT family N-acetyltransferase [Haloarchaeobius sp. HME9146]
MPGPVFCSGETVDLCPVEKDDLEFFRDAMNDPDVRPNLGSVTPYNMQMEEDWFENRVCEGDDVKLVIVADDEPVGNISLNGLDEHHGHAEVGYWVAPYHQRNGYGTDALRAATDYAFTERRLRTVMAKVFEFNEASAKVLESVGYERVGTLPDWGFVDGEHHDVNLYAVTADEWP